MYNNIYNLALWFKVNLTSLSKDMVTNYALYIIIGIIVYLVGSNFYIFNINNLLFFYKYCYKYFIYK